MCNFYPHTHRDTYGLQLFGTMAEVHVRTNNFRLNHRPNRNTQKRHSFDDFHISWGEKKVGISYEWMLISSMAINKFIGYLIFWNTKIMIIKRDTAFYCFPSNRSNGKLKHWTWWKQSREKKHNNKREKTTTRQSVGCIGWLVGWLLRVHVKGLWECIGLVDRK